MTTVRASIALAVPDLDAIRPACESSLSRAGRDHDLGAEFLRLGKAAPGQGLAGDAGREPEEVLDLRARAGLAAGHVGLDHEHVEALRRGKHGGREPGGAGADDQDVADVRRVDGFVEVPGTR